MEIEFKRASLFEEVWATPMLTLAAQYGLSDNGLRDICHTLNIPVPPRGYWAKKAAGHKVAIPALPKSACEESYTFRSQQQRVRSAPDSELAVWLTAQLSFEADSTNKVIVSAELTRPHPIVRQTAQALAEYRRQLDASRKRAEAPLKPHNRGQPNFEVFTYPRWHDYSSKGYIELRGDVLPLRVSLETVDRALRIWDALIKACVARKMEVSLGKDRLLITERGITSRLRISERLVQTALPTKGLSEVDIMLKRNIQYRSTGDLRIFVEGGYSNEWKVEDDSKSKLEEKLNPILCRIHSAAKAGIEYQVELAERRRLEQLEAERRELERQASAERQRLQELERKRQENLAAEAEIWKRSTTVREYLNAIRTGALQMKISNEQIEALNTWLAWAEQVADSMNPLSRRVTGQISEAP